MSPNIEYFKRAGGDITARFYYEADGTQHWDDGYFTEKANQAKSFAWRAVARPSTCNVIDGLFVLGQGGIP